MLGQACLELKDFVQARQYLEESLQLQRVLQSDSNDVLTAAKTLAMLGQALAARALAMLGLVCGVSLGMLVAAIFLTPLGLPLLLLFLYKYQVWTRYCQRAPRLCVFIWTTLVISRL